MATYSTPIPGVPQYGQAALAAKTAYGNALARLNQRRGSLLRQSGFAGDINAETGVVDKVRVDGSNQYGDLQQLNRSQAQRDESARWSGVERGLGSGGGLAAQLRSNERYDFGKEDSNLATQLMDSLSGMQDEQNTAAYDRDSALYQAQLDAARYSIQNEDFNPADLNGGALPAPGAQPMSTKAKPMTIPGASSAEQMRIQNALKAAQAASKKKTSPNLWFK